MREEREMGGQFLRQQPAGTGRASGEVTSLFEPGELGDYLGFVFRSVRRRWKLAASILVVFTAAAAAAVALIPRRYHVEARLFAMPVEGAPGALRGANGEPSGLAQGAAEVIVTHQNLSDLIREVDFAGRWRAERPPILRLVDRARQALGARALDHEEFERALIAYLQKKLIVQAKGADVTIAFDWPEPGTAHEVVKIAQQKLLSIRHAAELIPLERRVNAAEASTIVAQRRIDELVSRLDDVAKHRREGARASSVRGLQAQGKFRDLPDPRLAEERLQIMARRKDIAEMEDVRHKRLSELNAQLSEQKATLGKGHPALRDIEDRIRSFERQGTELDALKREEQRLLAAYVRSGGKEIELSDPGPTWSAVLKDDDEPSAYGKARIVMELTTLQQLLGQVAEARVALASAKASFDSRYIVIVPSEVPEKPAAPNVPMLMLAGIFGGLLLAVFGTVASDLRGGVIRETWQAQRRLDLAVLAEVPAP